MGNKKDENQIKIEDVMKNETLANKIWYIAYPILFYYAVMLITMSLAQWIIGNDYAHIVPCQLFATLITIPFMLPFYRQDQVLAGIPGSKPKITKKTVLSAAGTENRRMKSAVELLLSRSILASQMPT